MTFTELKKLMENEFDIIRLADIAREFDVSPQVVNNYPTGVADIYCVGVPFWRAQDTGGGTCSGTS